MPMGEYPNFEDCVTKTMEIKKITRLEAEKYCGSILFKIEREAKRVD